MRISAPVAALIGAASIVSGPLTALGAAGGDRYPDADLWLQILAAGTGSAALLIPTLVVIGAVSGRHHAEGGISLAAAIGAAVLAIASAAAIVWGLVGPDRPGWAELGLVGSGVVVPAVLGADWWRSRPSAEPRHQRPVARRRSAQTAR